MAAFAVGLAVGLALGGCRGPSGEDAGTDGATSTDVGVGTDSGVIGTDGSPSDSGSDGGVPGTWLYTAGNHIYSPDGTIFHGRGANIHDTRSCNACSWVAPDVAEVTRRVDELVDVWGANFMRLTLESYPDDGGFRLHFGTVLDDPAYLADVVAIVNHIGTKPGVYVLLSLWVDPNHSPEGWPTAGTNAEWALLAETFAASPHVLFGIINEPQFNFDGSQDPQVWTAMNDAVATIRGVEDGMGTPHHIVAVQGTGGWARRLDYYVTNPITAGGGENVAYEIHIYDPPTEFDSMLTQPAMTLPVIIGELGPAGMTEADCTTLMNLAESIEVPYLAWTFHMRCPPNLLVENSGGGCGVGMTLEPTSWGQLLMNRLAIPW